MKKNLYIVISSIAIILITLVLLKSTKVSQSPTLKSVEKAKDSLIKIVPESISSKMLFTGNVFWGRYIHDWSMASHLKYKYPFSRLNEFNRQDYDVWIGGLECPTVPNLKLTSAQQEETLTFNCPPEYLTEAKKFFDVFSLANNHTDNQGEDGFKITQNQLKKHDFQYFGHYDPRIKEDACEILGIPVTVKMSDNSSQKGKIPIAFCGYHGVFRIPPQESIDEISKYKNLMPVFAFPHMGAEYKSAPDAIKTNVHHALIDAGASAVIGDHPHWVQNTEVYKGKLNVYSMGNFMFDQQFNSEVTRSAAIKLTIKNQDKIVNLDKWLKIGEQCVKYKDNCLDTIKKANLDKIDFTFDYDFIATDNSDKITRPANSQITAAVRQRLNWQQTINNLKRKE